jgi:hypothetical protein
MEPARTFGGKKYMWDGEAYPGRTEAEEIGRKYRQDGFEVELIEEGEHCFLFTRRVVSEVVVEGQNP